ncbi:TetR/AcrR family transcriptional regulator [Subtercola frigoramans]|uniref:AcrR family transcriptional regulator n=1 Tax=Subtercola frigoramans TaxID=120298 RepID=A0ABS2L2E8_9MICO|nr:TetR/AcrR family transcriptional regulator [Subtercola frigoramans]MBM7471254.1 AcrR family transcriptional regulator [Subtercola frigoramans]
MPDGRRAQNKLEKQSRIHAAAAELLDRHGFANVTTQQIADRADVAIGTLFRYASTKSELLLMVYNDRYRQAIESGRAQVSADDGAVPSILALIAPLVVASREFAENAAAYQRELLYGDPTERYRSEGLRLTVELQDLFEVVLTRSISASPVTAVAARTLSDIVHLEIARAPIEETTAERMLVVLGQQTELIVAGLHVFGNTFAPAGSVAATPTSSTK